jgi:plasmid stabilization system protein ParE
MTKYKINFLSLATFDLVEIGVGLTGFPAKSSRFFTMLRKKTSLLMSNPRMCPAYDEIPLYRKLVVLDYLVFYTVDDTEKRVDIHRVLHGKLNIKWHLPS